MRQHYSKKPRLVGDPLVCQRCPSGRPKSTENCRHPSTLAMVVGHVPRALPRPESGSSRPGLACLVSTARSARTSTHRPWATSRRVTGPCVDDLLSSFTVHGAPPPQVVDGHSTGSACDVRVPARREGCQAVPARAHVEGLPTTTPSSSSRMPSAMRKGARPHTSRGVAAGGSPLPPAALRAGTPATRLGGHSPSRTRAIRSTQ